MTWGPFTGNANNRTTSNFAMRARGYITADAREQTAYGTARGYIAVGLEHQRRRRSRRRRIRSAPTAPSCSGRASPRVSHSRSMTSTACRRRTTAPAICRPPIPATAAGWCLAYTAQLGNGVSATLSAEARRTTQIIDRVRGLASGQCGATTPELSGSCNLQQQRRRRARTRRRRCRRCFPGQRRLWRPAGAGHRRQPAGRPGLGQRQVMGALHEVNPLYYSAAIPIRTVSSSALHWRFNLPTSFRLTAAIRATSGAMPSARASS